MKRLSEENQTNDCKQTTPNPCSGEGLSKVLSGLNAATRKNIISSTMAHLITCNNGSRFVFSHEFYDLLVRQMDATREVQDYNVHTRTSKVPSDALHSLYSSLADGFIHRPIQTELEDIFFMK